ncbi:MAG: permease [Phycisphaerae bacterium]
MGSFLSTWGESAIATLGFFWMAFWAFCLGYLISSMIQVFVTRQRMKQTMGEAGPKSVGLGTFFGFISSSCSFAALSTSRSIFQKGAGLVPALAFLLASTNLVIELGIVILVFLTWQFALAEYIGGVLLILIMWIVVKLTLPKGLEEDAREHARDFAGGGDDDEQAPDWQKRMKSKHGWSMVSKRFFMEWKMVWKDLLIGFTVAGVIAAFVPASFFRWLFPGSGSDPSWWQTALHPLIGPLAAFFTFIGSMGNIPLAGVLFASGVSFAGVIAFIFSDLVVFPVLRISARYFGWKMALYILGVFLVCIVGASLIMQVGYGLLGILPSAEGVRQQTAHPSERFAIDYTFFLNVGFAALAVAMAWLGFSSFGSKDDHQDRGESGQSENHEDNAEGSEDSDDGDGDGEKSDDSDGGDWLQKLLMALAIAAGIWTLAGTAVYAWQRLS